MADGPLLTVAIPTFNRNAILKANLERLLPQLTPECALLILDNHSTVPVAETLADLLQQYPDVRWQIIRHRVNIGGNANIVRCFELCDTPWMWTLGDDDAALPDAVSRILADIASVPDLACINYGGCFNPRERRFCTNGLEEFVRKAAPMELVYLISANVYNNGLLRPYCKLGFHYAYSCLPHVVMLLESLKRGHQCLFSSSAIFEWHAPASRDDRGSPIAVFLGFSTVPEIVVPQGNRLTRHLARKICGGQISLRSMATALLYHGVHTDDPSGARLLFNLAALRHNAVAGRLLDRLMTPIYRLALRVPRFSLAFDHVCRRLLGRKEYPERNPVDGRL